MISITTKIYDLNGEVNINQDPDSDLYKNSRRVSRTPTLDGGCVITDQGFSHGDRTLTITKKNISPFKAERVWYLFKTYSLIQVSFHDGCFIGAIQDTRLNEGNLQMKILIKEKISK